MIQNRRKKREITDEQQAELKDVFELFDLDKDNLLSAAECRFALRSLGFEMKTHQLLQILKENNYKEQKISYEQYFTITKKLVVDRDPLDEIRRAFQLFDEEGKGKISLKNLRKVANELGENVDDDELQAMIDEFDTDNDGEINEQEFIQLMLESI
eukprot:NODE_285_length_11794_cov_0.197178.p7 type:complete len:156 gc:universal NODE_285_length_11794_cov_0.197178:10887-11354(+)